MLPMVKRILYSTALSKNAEHTLGYATYLAKVTGAEVHILHIVGKLSNDAVVAMQTYLQDADSPKKIAQTRVQKAKQELQKRHDAYWERQAAEDQEIRRQIAGVHICEAYPADEILKRAKDLQCDLIIMGAHEKGFVNMLLGSVSNSVLRRSRIPVLVVPPL